MSPTGAEAVRLERGDARFPAALEARLGRDAPDALLVRGDPGLLRPPLTALFCSVRVPPELVLPTYDLARALRDQGVPVVGGFQSPLERECLDLLLRGRQPVALVPARDVATLRLPPAWRRAVEEGRLLLAGAPEGARRPTQAAAVRRNRLVAALAAEVCIAHGSPGGRLLRLAAEALAWGEPVRCLPHPENRDLLLLGAEEVEPARHRGGFALHGAPEGG